jgi:hypothetical protein
MEPQFVQRRGGEARDMFSHITAAAVHELSNPTAALTGYRYHPGIATTSRATMADGIPLDGASLSRLFEH